MVSITFEDIPFACLVCSVFILLVDLSLIIGCRALERYTEFTVEYLQKYGAAEKMYRMILERSALDSSVSR